ncbi:MAG: DUF3881 family protein [Lachnospiraceae bacterium]|nr:DUF3881 family protein [Lachnospiraceae bacterium]
MHKYLRTVGFSTCTRKQDESALLKRVEEEFTICTSTESYDGEEVTELDVTLAPGIGLRARGRYDAKDQFEREYYYPYCIADEIGTTAQCQIQRHTDKETYSGMCEDYRLGISLIFFIQNGLEYEERKKNVFLSSKVVGVKLSALASVGRILIPLKKTQEQIEKAKVTMKNRTALLEAARQGDESAVESLTLEDMNLFANLAKRLKSEDVYSILDSYFMPYGMESDQYSLMGTIDAVEEVHNPWTNEKVFIFKVDCNDISLNVAINAKDLEGEPAVGRRFKGDIWLQGTLAFEEV